LASLDLKKKKKSTTNVIGVEILGEPIRFELLSKVCKRKKNLALEMTFYIFCIGACGILLI
jgi:hypothetical protein